MHCCKECTCGNLLFPGYQKAVAINSVEKGEAVLKFLAKSTGISATRVKIRVFDEREIIVD